MASNQPDILDRIKLKAFRAVLNPDLCEEYVEGHSKVLSDLGIKGVTSAKAEWTQNPYSYVIGAWSENTGNLIGGARIDVAGDGYNLPIESAVGYKDDKIYQIVENAKADGAAELCGLWTDMRVSGMGTAVLLIRAATSILPSIGVGTMYVLCAEATFGMFKNIGCEIILEIGNNGTFYYPKLDWIATALVLSDIHNVPLAEGLNKERILDLRNNPYQRYLEVGPKGQVMVNYEVGDLEPWTIINNKYKTKI